jgi:hypothetical protein
VLLKKFFNVGFADITVAERAAFGLDDLGRYPLFAPDFLEFLRQAIPPARHRELVFSIAVTASKSANPAR